MLDTATQDQLEIGLYKTGETRTEPRFYDITLDEFFHDVPVELMVAVRPPGPLPVGVESARYRRDGNRVIMAWCLTDEAKKMIDYHREQLRREMTVARCDKCGFYCNTVGTIPLFLVHRDCGGTFQVSEVGAHGHPHQEIA